MIFDQKLSVWFCSDPEDPSTPRPRFIESLEWHRTQNMVLLISKTDYGGRLQSKISKEKKARGQVQRKPGVNLRVLPQWCHTGCAYSSAVSSDNTADMSTREAYYSVPTAYTGVVPPSTYPDFRLSERRDVFSINHIMCGIGAQWASCSYWGCENPSEISFPRCQQKGQPCKDSFLRTCGVNSSCRGIL